MTTPMERRLASSVVQTEPDDGGTETALHGFHVSPITFHLLPLPFAALPEVRPFDLFVALQER